MKIARHITMLLLSMLLLSLPSAAAEKGEGGGIDLQHILFGHIQDSYEWHVTDLFGKPVVMHLPMIFYSEHTGFHTYCSSSFAEEAEEMVDGPAQLGSAEPTLVGLRPGPDGFAVMETGGKGTIVERVGGQWTPVAADISISKQVVVLFIDAFLLLLCILIPARWCKRHKPSDPAPGGFVGLMHMFVMSVYNDMVKGILGEKADKYAPYLLTCFFFIFLANIMGVVPFPPGGGNITGNITITFFLALCTFLIVNVTGTRHYWKDIFWGDVPWWLKVPVPLMPFIEFFGIFTKPIALMIRLFANMLAGHVIAISLSCIIFIKFALGGAMGNVLGGIMTPVSLFLSIFMMLLEVLVCYIQAMVFTMLSAVFISMSNASPEHH
jgi:F-type H+-transporting ATPase subunit a